MRGHLIGGVLESAFYLLKQFLKILSPLIKT